VVCQEAAISSAVHPPSRKATAFSVGWVQSESLSPPMPIAWPVIPAEASEARKTMSPATSSTVPRPMPLRSQSGSGRPVRSASSMISVRPGMVLVISVAAAGTTAFTVIWNLASSIAQVRAMATMPALAAA